MGKNNRQRRAAKRRNDARRGTRYDHRHDHRHRCQHTLDELVEGAAILLVQGDVEGFRALAAALAAGPSLVEGVIGRQLAEAKLAAHKRGWTPAEVRRVLQKQLSARHARLAGAELERWAAAEGLDRPAAVAGAIEVLSWLMRMPPLPMAAPAPRRVAAADARQLERIRALLAKAESTTFAEEADALTAKAQELMTRYAIDQAMVAGSEGGAERAPSVRRVAVDDPYAGPKSLLLSEIASANRCRAVWSQTFGFSTVFGFEPDLDGVELLFTSLLVQASAGLKARSDRSYRQSFLVAYAIRIGARLREATAASTTAAAQEHGNALAPVLLADTAAVEEACQAAFPRMVNKGFSANSSIGWAAGVTAANLADLSTRDEIDVLQKLVV